LNGLDNLKHPFRLDFSSRASSKAVFTAVVTWFFNVGMPFSVVRPA
jgi:hypothetical protein